MTKPIQFVSLLQGKVNQHPQFIYLIIFVLAIISKIAFLQFRTVALDEPFSFNHARMGIKYILSLPYNNDPHPPLFYLILHFWLKIVGFESIGAMKMLNILIHSLCAIAIFCFGKRFIGTLVGLISATIFVFSDPQFFFALDLRAYELKTFFAISSSYHAYRYLERPSRKNILLWALHAALLLYTHYFGIILVFFQTLYGLVITRAPKRVLFFLLLFILFSSPALVAMGIQFLFHTSDSWMQAPVITDLYKYLTYMIAPNWVIAPLFGIIGMVVIFHLVKKNFDYFRSPSFYCLFLFLSAYLFMFFISFYVPMFSLRYTVFLSPLLFLGVIGSFNTIRIRYFPEILVLFLLYLQLVHFNPARKDLYYRNLDGAINHHTESQLIKTEVPILIYPFWFHHGFLFHYDREAFFDPSVIHYQYLAKEHNVHSFWDIDQMVSFIDQYQTKKLRLFLDEFDELRLDHLSGKLEAIGYEIKSQEFFEACTFICEVGRN